MGVEIIFPNSTNDGFHRVNGFKGIILVRTRVVDKFVQFRKIERKRERERGRERKREKESSMNLSFIAEKLISSDRIFLFLIT